MVKRSVVPVVLSPAMPEWKIKVDILKTFFNIQEAVIRKPLFRKPVLI
jgi:hypothetical protein